MCSVYSLIPLKVRVLMDNALQNFHQLVPKGRSNGDDQQQKTVIESLLDDILQSLEAGDCETAKTVTLDLRTRFKTTNGQTSRKRGGFQYHPIFMLDAVTFTDCLRPLKTDLDSVQDALQKHHSNNYQCTVQ